MSSITESLNKSFFVYENLCLYKSMSNKFFCTNLSEVKSEILLPFLEPAIRSVP